MAIADDVARVTRELWRINMAAGWQSRWRPGDTGKLAKAAGATPAQVRAWMSGEVQPTTAQALAVLDALPFPAVGFPALTEAAS